MLSLFAEPAWLWESFPEVRNRNGTEGGLVFVFKKHRPITVPQSTVNRGEGSMLLKLLITKSTNWELRLSPWVLIVFHLFIDGDSGWSLPTWFLWYMVELALAFGNSNRTLESSGLIGGRYLGWKVTSSLLAAGYNFKTKLSNWSALRGQQFQEYFVLLI